jgi:hypothetical protein
MSKVKLKLVEIASSDAHSNGRHIKPGDVIEFDHMPNFNTWEFEGPMINHPSNGFDRAEEAVGTNLRTGERHEWCFHAVKFEKVSK